VANFGDGERLRYQAIIEAACEAIISTDRDGLIQIWNHGAELLFGYLASEVVGKSLDCIVPERLRSAHWDGFQRAVNTGQIRNAGRVLTTRSVHKNGTKLYVDLTFGLITDEVGTVTGTFAVGRDSTARFVAEKDLRSELMDLREKLESSPSLTSPGGDGTGPRCQR
jgi:PAS domain S-box-containing protein